MSQSDLQTQIAAAKAYEQLFVPALFSQWTSRVTDLAQISPGNRVLDVACGTGVLAREAASRVGSHGSVAGVDPSPGMLAVAAELAPLIEWREGTAEALPYEDRHFDAVVSQFGLMFFADRNQALKEMHRVLKNNGHLAVAVWSSLETLPVYATLVAFLERTAGNDAANALRAPFVLGDANELVQLITSGGFTDVNVTTASGVGQFPSIRVMVEAELRGWLPLMGVVLPEDQIQLILGQADEMLRAHISADGTFELAALIGSGRKS